MKYTAALLAGASLLLSVSAQAAPIGGAQAAAEQVTTAPVAQKVWWRRWGYGYGPYYGHRPWGYGYYRPYYGYGYPRFGYGYGHRYWRHW